MTQSVIQTSFASGELAPSLFARVDLVKYHQGAATMRNYFVDYRSGASTRMGTKVVAQAKISSKAVRIIPFQSSILVPYMLEFGDFYVRPSSFGSPVEETPFGITGITQANPMVVSVPGHNFVVGNWVFINGAGGMLQVNGRTFVVLATTVGTVTLGSTANNVPTNSINYTAYTSGGSIGRIYEFTSPYAAADLALIKFVQVANTMYITHPSYAPQILTFVNPTSWNFAAIVFGSTVTSPGTPTVTANQVGTASFSYVISALDSAGQESTPSNPGSVTNAINISATAGSITATWGAVAGAAGYNVYKAELVISGPTPSGAAFGFIGTCDGTTFVDSNIVPDFAQTPEIAKNPFSGGNNPGTVCFFQQRIYYGGSNNFPQTFWASQPGFYNNFNVTDPVVDDNSFTGTLVSLQVNFIKSMVPMPGGLIILTAKGAWQLSSGSSVASTGAVTPTNATATPQAYNGVSDVPPIPISGNILYVQAKGSIVRDLTYNIYANIYTGADISVLSNHLFFGYQISQWAYAEEPFKVVWAIRSDGAMLSLTYVKEQEIQGWARHDTLGQFKSIATVTENTTDAVYVVVKRFIGNQWLQFVERMADRIFPYGSEDAWCVDCGSQSGLTSPTAGLSISASTGQATFTADAAVFNSASVGQILRADGGIATIDTFVSPTQVLATWTQTPTAILPNDPNETPLPVDSGSWSVASNFTTFLGLDYLEGQTVSILADGNVVPPQVVTNGSITLAQPASKVTVGLKFQTQLETMPLDLGNEMDTIAAKRKKISALTIRMVNTRGLSFGQDFAGQLTPIKEFAQNQTLGSVIPLVTGDERVIMDPLWEETGQICLQGDDPLPATVLGVIPEITIGDK